MKVRDIMSSPVIETSPRTSIRSALETMRARDIGALAVVSDGAVEGIVTDRDIILGALPGAKPDMPVGELMTRDPAVCGADDEVERAAELMGDLQVRRLPVVDAAGALVGFLSLSDIAEHASEELAGQALGEIVEDRGPPRRDGVRRWR